MGAPLDKTPRRIAAMFSAIAERYDRANHLLSFNQDRRWRAQLVRWAGVRAGMRLLDLCTGTGDLALALAHAAPVEVVGLDLSEGMLAVARAKAGRAEERARLRFVRGDALAIPFPDETFERVTISFGLRNLPDYRRGLAEIVRVLKPGGWVLIMEFARPGGLWGGLYRFYLRSLMPLAGGWLTGQRDPYRYLHDSIQRFPAPQELSALLAEVGLSQIAVRSLSGGIARVYRAGKPADPDCPPRRALDPPAGQAYNSPPSQGRK